MLPDLTETQRHRLTQSPTFCMLPWMHLHAWPDGQAFPCCLANGQLPVGNLKQNTMKEVWNDTAMRRMRQNMLADRPCNECQDCYNQEASGMTSMRNNSNQSFAQYIDLADQTADDGSLPDMRLHYWDVRFSNVCNLKCRSCSSVYSSRWYDDDLRLHGRELRPRVLYAGRHDEDMWEQMQEHIPYLSQIYFAGGEPLIMEEHNRILKLLIEKGNTNVRLTYSTNLNELKFKRENVLDLWKHFPNIFIGASLDDMGDRAAIIRSGTRWAQVEQNLRDLQQQCPHVEFMLTPTLSLMNIWNFVSFHRYMVDQGFIRAGDFDVNILRGPQHYCIDLLPLDIKQQFKTQFEEHIIWLENQGNADYAVNGFRAAIDCMMATDNSHMLKDFWKTVDDLDWSRSESLLSVVPELQSIVQHRIPTTRIAIK